MPRSSSTGTTSVMFRICSLLTLSFSFPLSVALSSIPLSQPCRPTTTPPFIPGCPRPRSSSFCGSPTTTRSRSWRNATRHKLRMEPMLVQYLRRWTSLRRDARSRVEHSASRLVRLVSCPRTRGRGGYFCTRRSRSATWCRYRHRRWTWARYSIRLYRHWWASIVHCWRSGASRSNQRGGALRLQCRRRRQCIMAVR